MISFEVEAKLRYARQSLPKGSLRIVGKANDYRDELSMLQDPNSEFVWEIFSGSPTRDAIPHEELRNYFEVTRAKINGKNMSIETLPVDPDDPAAIYAVHTRGVDEIDTERENDGFPYLIEIEFNALQTRKYSCIAAYVKYITKKFSVSVDYTKVPYIENVFQMNHIVGDELAIADKRSFSRQEIISVEHRGWVFPQSGVTFTWSESDEDTEQEAIGD